MRLLEASVKLDQIEREQFPIFPLSVLCESKMTSQNHI